jgi:hypothetical protein
MTVRIGARELVVLSAVTCLLLASGHTTAQAPPGAPPQADAAKRLQAAQQEIGRALQLLDNRPPAAPLDAAALEKSLSLVNQAREMLVDRVEKQQREYQDWKLKNPFVLFGQGGRNLYADRLANDEAVLQDLQRRQAEVAARMTLVKNVGDSEKDASALLLLIHRRGVDLAAIRQAAGKEIVAPLEMLRLYAASLRLESEELQQLIASAEERRDRGAKAAREMNAYEIHEERLRANLEQSRELLRAIVKRLQEISLIKSVSDKG